MPAALAIVALWGFAEATLFFIVADAPIMAVGLRHGLRAALAAALLAAIAAALGGLVTLEWAAAAPQTSRDAIESLPGITPPLFDGAAGSWRDGGAWAMLKGSFSGVPYKLYAHAAGTSGAAPIPFFLASIAARLPRFLLVALASGLAGPPLRRRLPPMALWVLFCGCWSGFYAVYLVMMESA